MLTEDRSLPTTADEGFIRRLSHRLEETKSAVVFTFVVSLLLAFVLAIYIQPIPRVHDEFSYLLAADSFSQLKSSAETHPHWKHFESFHVIHQPRYASKYPPGQGMILALGIWLGHPIIGSCVATAFALAATMWMLTGWIDKSHQAFAALLVATHPGIQVIWGQTYWSGCLAMAGSAMLLGSLFKLTSAANYKYSLTAGAGTSLLMISRPFEGLVLTIAVGLVIAYRFMYKREWSLYSLSNRVLLPGLAVTIVSFGLVLAYNQSITGEATTFPYQVHEDEYSWNRVFFWQSPKEVKPNYRHRELARFYETDAADKAEKYGAFVSGLGDKLEFALTLQYLFFGSTFLIGIVGLNKILAEQKYWQLMFLIGLPLAAAFMTSWNNTHYAAPAAAPILVFAVGSFFAALGKFENHSTKRLLVISALLLHAFWIGKEAYSIRSATPGSWWHSRQQIVDRLKNEPGNDLVFVRYSESHIMFQAWVYNQLNIDESEVVWAREMGQEEDEKLVEYFSDRKVWLVQPDMPERLIEPYSVAAGN